LVKHTTLKYKRAINTAFQMTVKF